jgi:hypothetical protein
MRTLIVEAPLEPSAFALANSLELTFAPQVGFELGEDTEHIEEALAGGCAGIDRLLSGLQDRALRFEGADNILQVADRARQAIDTRDHQHVTLAEQACSY